LYPSNERAKEGCRVSEELGRPSYKARPTTPPSAVPPLPTDKAAASPSDRRSRSRRAPRDQGGQQPPRVKPDAAPPTPPTPPKPPNQPKQPKFQKPAKQPKQPKPTKQPTKARRQEDPPTEVARPAYTPVKPGRSLGYVLWHLLRYTTLLVLKLARTMFKVALSAFHIAG
jgi:hypothetical protein